MSQCPIHELNKLLPSKRELYEVLSHSDHYSLQLPKFGSKAITINYLLQAANGIYFSTRKQDYKEAKTRSAVNKIDFYAGLITMVPNLGFGTDNLPNKKWIGDVFFSINPGHQLLRCSLLEKKHEKNFKQTAYKMAHEALCLAMSFNQPFFDFYLT